MKIFNTFSKLIQTFDGLLMKNHSCICCGKEISDDNVIGLCKMCYGKLAVISGKTCVRCGEIVDEDNLYCDECKNKTFAFSKNTSFCVYDDISAKIIHGFKYNSRKYYAEPIANMMNKNRFVFKDIDLITFVPIGTQRMNERGYNQAEEFAREISKMTEIPCESLLVKIKQETHQAGQTRKDRIKNIVGTIGFDSTQKDKVVGKRILVIDDVFTTGSTLNECAKVLSKHKAKDVQTYTFAKTRNLFYS